MFCMQVSTGDVSGILMCSFGDDVRLELQVILHMFSQEEKRHKERQQRMWITCSLWCLCGKRALSEL